MRPFLRESILSPGIFLIVVSNKSCWKRKTEGREGLHLPFYMEEGRLTVSKKRAGVPRESFEKKKGSGNAKLKIVGLELFHYRLSHSRGKRRWAPKKSPSERNGDWGSRKGKCGCDPGFRRKKNSTQLRRKREMRLPAWN